MAKAVKVGRSPKCMAELWNFVKAESLKDSVGRSFKALFDILRGERADVEIKRGRMGLIYGLYSDDAIVCVVPNLDP
jgi:hypothetical protein